MSLSEDCKEQGLKEQGVGRKLINHDKKQQSCRALSKTLTHTFMNACMSATPKASTASQRGLQMEPSQENRFGAFSSSALLALDAGRVASLGNGREWKYKDSASSSPVHRMMMGETLASSDLTLSLLKTSLFQMLTNRHGKLTRPWING